MPEAMVISARIPQPAPIPQGNQPEGRLRSPKSFAFGPFLLQPERQLLLRDGRAVRIGGRAFDILTMLASRPGQLIGKHELIEIVWPSLFVDESNLKANMAMLRRALGESHAEPRYIATVIGRGYRFVSPVRAFGDGYGI